MKSVQLFEKIGSMVKENESKGAEIVKKVGAIYHFKLAEKKGADPVTFTIDLKNGNGKVVKGAEGTPDATFEMLDADFIALTNKTLNPQQAFMQGKMKIKGNMASAMKFNLDLFPPIPKL